MPNQNKGKENPTSPALESCVHLSQAYATAIRKIDGKLSSLHGLNFGDFTILYHLAKAHELRLRRIDLAEHMGVTASAVTRSLLPLEKIGLVARQADARDARVGYACLTPAGSQLFADALPTANEICGEAVDILWRSAARS